MKNNELKKLKYAIVGSGAVGALYGGLLTHFGAEVHFLFHSDYPIAQSRGLLLESPKLPEKSALIPVNAYARSENMPICDVILIALKTTSNHLLPDLVRPLLHSQSVILTLQNGLGCEEELQQYFPQHEIWGGLCFLCSNKIAPAHIKHLDLGLVKLGVFSSQLTKDAHVAIKNQFLQDWQRANIDVLWTDNLLLERWQKLVWNIPYNGLSVVLRADTKQLMACEQTRDLLYDLMLEVRSGAASQGIEIDESFLQKRLLDTEKMPPYKTSMMLDYENNRPLETKHIYEEPLRRATKASVQLPKIQMLAQQLRFFT